MTPTNRRRVDEWSKQLFGSKHLLVLAVAVSEASVVRARDIQAATGLAASSVHKILQTLVAVRLLERLEREAGEREQRYRRQEHPFWDAANVLSRQAQHSETRTDPDGTSGRMVDHDEDS